MPANRGTSRGVAARVVAGVLIGLFTLAAAHAQDARAGRRVALMCQGCHGMDGLSKQPDAPNLAAQPETYLAKQMAEYKSKQRRHEQMNVVAEALTESEIAEVAAYYAAIEIEGVKTPNP